MEDIEVLQASDDVFYKELLNECGIGHLHSVFVGKLILNIYEGHGGDTFFGLLLSKLSI